MQKMVVAIEVTTEREALFWMWVSQRIRDSVVSNTVCLQVKAIVNPRPKMMKSFTSSQNSCLNLSLPMKNL